MAHSNDYVDSASLLTRGRLNHGEEYQLANLTFDAFGPFGGNIMIPQRNLITLSGVYPLSDLRDEQTTSGTGSIGASTRGEYRLRNATGGDKAVLLSQQRGRYVPGGGGQAGIGVRLAGSIDTDTDNGSFAEWGYFDLQTGTTSIQDGFVFGYDKDGLYVRGVDNGTEAFKTYQANWNILNDLALNPLTDGDGRIYQVDFTYYGHGLIRFQIVDPTTGDYHQETRVVHTIKRADTTSISNPNLKVGARVGSTSGTDDFSVYVSGRKFDVIGHFRPPRRTTGDTRVNVATSTTVIPMVSFRKKSTTTFKPITVGIGSLDVLAASASVIGSIVVGGTLTSASWAAPSGVAAGETALEIDKAATAISGGVKVWEGLFPAGQGNQTSMGRFTDITAEIPDGDVVSFCVRSTSGTGTASVTGRMTEEW